MNRPGAARILAVTVALLAGGWACSSSGRRDQSYGTDLGVGWVPGDGSAVTEKLDAATPDARGDASDAADAREAATAEAAADAPSLDAASGDTL